MAEYFFFFSVIPVEGCSLAAESSNYKLFGQSTFVLFIMYNPGRAPSIFSNMEEGRQYFLQLEKSLCESTKIV